MREFMEYVQSAFYQATGWSRDNSYSSLNSTADALLNFPTPRGLRLTLSSLATPHFATSYQLGSLDIVDGSIAYLYASVPLAAHLTPRSEALSLRPYLRSYRSLTALPRRHDPLAIASSQSLLYGRLYLPQSLLEALVVKRVTSALQLQLSAVSSQTVKNGGTLLGLAQYDIGRYSVEGLYSSDGGLLGLRGIYNFGGDAEETALRPTGAGEGVDDSSRLATAEKDKVYGRFSAGGEIYYGTLNKSGGMSLGARFATLPAHRGTPLTATLTLNPLMGSVSASYAVVAGQHISLATRMSFNVYSYESDWAIGMELWRKNIARSVDEAGSVVAPPSGAPLSLVERRIRERSFQAKLEWRMDDPEILGSLEPGSKAIDLQKETKAAEAEAEARDEYAGVLKARVDQNLRIGLVWEGRIKSLLFSLGSGIELRKPDSPFRTLGLELQFSS